MDASIDHVDILPEFLSSENCPDGPDGSYGCPYPTILDALENAQGGQSILVREGRYSDLIFADFINQSTHLEGPKIEVIGESDDTYIDGTVEVNALTSTVPSIYVSSLSPITSILGPSKWVD